MVGIDFASAPKFVETVILDPLWRFLFKGKELKCSESYGAGWVKYPDDTVPYCIVVEPPGSEGFQTIGAITPNGVNNMKLLKKRYTPRNNIEASELNCPPGTTPFNGQCFQACLPDYTQISKPGDGKNLECLASCDKAWHGWNWKHVKYENLPQPLEQKLQERDGWCFHVNYDEKKDGLTAPVQRLKPYNLLPPVQFDKIQTNPRIGQRPISADCAISNVQPSGLFDEKCYEANGLYATRRAMSLDNAVLPEPCNPPNQVTSSGNCAVPCPPSYELRGDVCVMVSQQCPENYDPYETYCVPKIQPLKYGWSIISIFSVLIGICAVALLMVAVVKLVK